MSELYRKVENGWRSFRDGSVLSPIPADPTYVEGWGTPVWADEFDSPGIDFSKWNARNNATVQYDQAIIYSANNIIPGDGFLYQRIGWINPPIYRTNRDRWFSVGYLDTINKFWQRYGRWEVRAKLPLKPGKSFPFWPAFWLRDQSGAGECDIMEAIGSPHRFLSQQPEGSWSIAMHQSTNGDQANLKMMVPTSQVYLADQQFHTFTVEWTPVGFRFLCDGVERYFPKTAQYPWFETAFPGGCNIRLNSQCGESWMGFYTPTDPASPYLSGTSTEAPADMVVDYVRVWAYTP